MVVLRLQRVQRLSRNNENGKTLNCLVFRKLLVKIQYTDDSERPGNIVVEFPRLVNGGLDAVSDVAIAALEG